MKWVLLAHVMGGATWFGASVYVEGLMAGAARTRDPEVIMSTGLRVAGTNERILPAAAVVTGVFGVWLVLGTAWDFEELFVIIGFVIVIVGLAFGAFYFKPKAAEIESLVAENGLTDATAMARMKSMANVGHVMTLLVTVAFVAMVLKL